MKPDEIRGLVRDELASLGGRLLATHGPTTDTPNDVTKQTSSQPEA